MKKYIVKPFFIALTLSLASASFADYAVIVNPANNANINKEDIARLFLSKVKKFADGSQAIPINSASGSEIRMTFNTAVAGKNESQMKAYWSTLVFTGKGVPPKEVSSDSEMMDLVGKNPSVIGYVDSNSVNDSVKVVLTFQ